MISFKVFLEATAKGSKSLKFSDLTVDKAVNMLNTYCKNALWMLEKDTPLYRGHNYDGFYDLAGTDYFRAIDTSLTTRKSQNTNNIYTTIFDNTPSMKEFPKRSKSFIGSSNIERAAVYDYDGDTYVMIPFDDAKIGLVNVDDIWDVRIDLFGEDYDIESANGVWASVLRHYGFKVGKVTYSDFVQLSKIVDKDKTKFAKLINAIDRDIDDMDVLVRLKEMSLINYIDELYSPETTGMTWGYSNSEQVKRALAKDDHSEIWISGKIVIISQSMWSKLRSAYRQK